MRIREMALITAAALLLTACSDSPSDTDIQAALQPRLEGASCVKAAMFNRFPVTLSDGVMSGTSSANQPAFDALTDAGLLAKSANTYSLTDNGWKKTRRKTVRSPRFCCAPACCKASTVVMKRCRC